MNDNGWRQRFLEKTLRALGETFGRLSETEIAFVKALDLSNLTLEKIKDIPSYGPDGLPQPYR
jgi:hypothetical protein